MKLTVIKLTRIFSPKNILVMKLTRIFDFFSLFSTSLLGSKKHQNMKSFFTPIYQRFERVDQSTNLTNLTWWVPGVTNLSCFTPCYSTILPRQAVTMSSNIANFTHIEKPRNTAILGLFCQKKWGIDFSLKNR